MNGQLINMSSNAPRSINVSKIGRRGMPAPKASSIATRKLPATANSTTASNASILTRNASTVAAPMPSKPGTKSTVDLKSINFKVGDKIELLSNIGKVGLVKFVGETKFAPGPWIGVELTTEDGKNDGSVKGVKYFEAKPGFGVFCRPGGIKIVPVTPDSGVPVSGNSTQPPSESCSTATTTTRVIENSEPAQVSTPSKIGRRLLKAPDTASKLKTTLATKLASGDASLARSISPASPVSPKSTKSDNESNKYQFRIGERVVVSGTKVGIVQFIGPTQFQEGIWVGVQLDRPMGKNDGSVKGVRYFTCEPNYGVMAPINRIVRAGMGGPPPGAMRRENSALSVSSFGSMTSQMSNVAAARKRAAAESRAKILMAKQRAAARSGLDDTMSRISSNSKDGPKLRSKPSSLSTQIAKVSHPLSGMKDEIKEKEQQISKLLQQIDELQEDNAALQGQIRNLSETLAENRDKKFNNSDGEIEFAKQEVRLEVEAEFENKMLEMEDENLKAIDKIEALEKDLKDISNNAKENYDALEKSLEKTQQEKHKIEEKFAAELKEKDDTIHSMKLALATANETVSENTKDLETKLQIQIENNIANSEENVILKQKMEDLTSELTQKSAELENQQKSVCSLEKEKAELKNLETEQEELMSKYLDMEDQIANLESSNKFLEEKNSKLQEQILEGRNQSEDSESKINEKEEEIKIFQEQISNLKIECDQVKVWRDFYSITYKLSRNPNVFSLKTLKNYNFSTTYSEYSEYTPKILNPIFVLSYNSVFMYSSTVIYKSSPFF